MIELLNPLAGLLVGILVGFTGVGGGALMTPILVFLFGIAPQTAVGTDLLFASMTKAVGGWVHGRRGSIDWLVLRRLSLGSLPAAALTVAMLHCAAAQDGLRAMLLPTLGVALVLTAIAMLFKAQLYGLGRTAAHRFPGAVQALPAATDRPDVSVTSTPSTAPARWGPAPWA